MPRVTIVDTDGKSHRIDAPDGATVLELAHAHGLDLEGTCEGAMACATCHVIIDRDWYERLPVPTAGETDMLGMAYEPTPTSRLGCQVRITDELDGLRLKLAPGM